MNDYCLIPRHIAESIFEHLDGEYDCEFVGDPPGPRENYPGAGEHIAVLRAAIANPDNRFVRKQSVESLIDAAHKVIAWLGRLAVAADKQADSCTRFSSLVEACRADAKNYRATAADLKRAVDKAEAA